MICPVTNKPCRTNGCGEKCYKRDSLGYNAETKQSMRTERLQESWFTFSRMWTKSGFIDRWVGDMANNPNRKEQSLYSLNAFSEYFRLNGKGEWLHRDSFKDLHNAVITLREMQTAEEIWDSNLIK